MIPRPPRSTRTDTFLPYATLFRSHVPIIGRTMAAGRQEEVAFAPFFAAFGPVRDWIAQARPDEIGRHTSELQSLMRISYAVYCLKTKNYTQLYNYNTYYAISILQTLHQDNYTITAYR